MTIGRGLKYTHDGILENAPVFFLGFPAVGDVADRLDGADTIAQIIKERRRCYEEVSPFTATHGFRISFRIKRVAFSLHIAVQGFEVGIAGIDEIHHVPPSLAIKGNHIGMVSLSEHVFFTYPGHLFNSQVPGDDFSVQINNKSCIRQKLDNAGKLAFRSFQRLLHLPAVVDVPGNTNKRNKRSIRTKDRGAACFMPPPGAVGSQDPVSQAWYLFSELDCLQKEFVAKINIIGMNKRLERLANHVGWLIPEDPFP